jgi:hypothetical protein
MAERRLGHASAIFSERIDSCPSQNGRASTFGAFAGADRSPPSPCMNTPLSWAEKQLYAADIADCLISEGFCLRTGTARQLSLLEVTGHWLTGPSLRKWLGCNDNVLFRSCQHKSSSIQPVQQANMMILRLPLSRVPRLLPVSALSVVEMNGTRFLRPGSRRRPYTGR